jgi:hypothetical protein
MTKMGPVSVCLHALSMPTTLNAVRDAMIEFLLAFIIFIQTIQLFLDSGMASIFNSEYYSI